MTLTVNPTYNVTDAATICADLLPYTWNGITFTEAGTQVATLQTVNGCDSVVTMTLTVNALPTITITGETAICQGESTTLTAAGASTYAWSTDATTAAINVNQSGTYTVTGTDANGCVNSANVTVIVNMPTTGTDVQTACNSYTWIDGTTYTASTNMPTYTLTNAAGCDSVVTLNLTINYSSYGTETRAICANELPYTWNGVTFTAAGTETATLTNAAGCDSIVTMTLAVNSLPTITISGNEVFCQGGSTTLTAAGASTYAWSTAATTAAINVDQAGTYTVTGTDVNGCTNTANVTVTMNVPTTGVDEQTACDSYTWIDGNTYTASTNTPTYTLTNAAGCDSVVTLHLTINNSVTSEFTIETNEGCYNWNGTEYCQSGDYTQNLQTAAGCDSVVTLHLTVGVGVEDFEIENVFLTPNPATNVCRINGLETVPASVDLYDMNGKLVRHATDTEFDVSMLPTGIYMVRVTTDDNRIINLKMVKR
jgi:hypothetical protein